MTGHTQLKEYGQTKTGMWHTVGDKFLDGDICPVCQSYNLDRPNYIKKDTITTEKPTTGKFCKKCCK